jgi:ABC-type branched-subunit amino acid transport system ATPase component/ABC-type branched-subunit amino acid transport system permease subunit
LVITVAVLAAIAVAIPLTDDYTQSLLATVAITTIGAMSLTVLMGWVGQPSILNAALLLVGGYAGYVSYTLWHLPLIVAMAVTGVVGIALGAVAALPARRLGGLYLALGTIAIHFIVLGAGNVVQTRTNAVAGYFLQHPSLFGIEIRSSSSWLWFTGVVALVIYLYWRYLRATRVGRAWIIIRESRDAAGVAGVDVPLLTGLAFALTSGAVAIAGMLLALFLNSISFESYGLLIAVNYIVMITIGGTASLGGAVFGAAVVTLLPQFLGTLLGSGSDSGWVSANLFNIESLVYGVVGVLILLFAPGGVAKGATAVSRWLARGWKSSRRQSRATTSIAQSRAGKPLDDRALLNIRDLSVTYSAGELAVDGVSLEIGTGSSVVVIGRNGAGKTSLLHAIAGFPPGAGGRVSHGSISFNDGHDHPDLTSSSVPSRARKGITFVPAEDKVFPDLTISEHLREALASSSRRASATPRRWTRLDDVWKDFPILHRRSGSMAASLSGGERTQLALACALARNPRLLVMDEASLGLSPVAIGQVIDMLKTVKESREVTLLIAEQNPSVATAIADSIAVLDDGVVRATGEPTAEIIAEVERAYLGEGVITGALEQTTPIAQTRTDHRATDVILTVRDVSVRVGGVESLTHVSFNLHRRQMLGLVGANGAGKTSLLNAICGYYRVTNGDIHVLGTAVGRRPPYRVAAAGVSRTFQLVGQIRGLTVTEFVKIGLEPTWSCSVFETLVRTPRSSRAEAAATRSALGVLEWAGLLEYKDRLLEECPYGVRKLADVARACAAEPAILLLDEPTSGASAADRLQIQRLLLNYLVRKDTALILVDHDVDFVTNICNELVVLSVGHVIRQGMKEDVLKDPEVIRTFLGPSHHQFAGSQTDGGK